MSYKDPDTRRERDRSRYALRRSRGLCAHNGCTKPPAPGGCKCKKHKKYNQNACRKARKQRELRSVHETIAQLNHKIDLLRRALKPFTEIAFHPNIPDADYASRHPLVRVGDYRLAASTYHQAERGA